MTFCCIVFITVTLSILACAASLKCFNCTGVTHMNDCQSKTKCGENEVCYTQRQYSGQISYDLGCMDSKKCGDFASLPSGISRIDTKQENTNPCFECCSRKTCNSQLCQYKDSDVCVDDERVDCAFLNSLFNLCKDINQAKKVCPKYCKLCHLVDGSWTPWSNCDVTCENGTQIRTRGNDTETKSCQRGPCPIHGGWNTWSTWSECSVSCDIGMQHRDRSCTSPRPSLFGDHCFGDSRDDRICMPGACADGGWTDWGSWGICSESCAGGIMSRNRTCSNPAPSMTGKQCLGNSEQVSQCNKQACQDDVWTTWGNWSTCSESCAGGIMSRTRTCSNPVPSITGIQCVGNSEQVSLCNKQACPENNVAFTVYDIDRNSVSSGNLRFQQTYTNYGSGYNTTTGKFTCKLPGVYHFVVSLCKYRQDINIIYSSLRINGSLKLQLHFYPEADGRNEVGNYMMTGAGTFHLGRYDVVEVFGNPKYFTPSSYSYFTGFLITPDQ